MPCLALPCSRSLSHSRHHTHTKRTHKHADPQGAAANLVRVGSPQHAAAAAAYSERFGAGAVAMASNLDDDNDDGAAAGMDMDLGGGDLPTEFGGGGGGDVFDDFGDGGGGDYDDADFDYGDEEGKNDNGGEVDRYGGNNDSNGSNGGGSGTGFSVDRGDFLAMAPLAAHDVDGLVSAERQVGKLSIRYATSAKCVNVKKLKRELWSGIEERSGAVAVAVPAAAAEEEQVAVKGRGKAPLAEEQEEEEKKMEEGEKEEEQISFSNLMTELAATRVRDSAVTVPFFFLCVSRVAFCFCFCSVLFSYSSIPCDPIPCHPI